MKLDVKMIMLLAVIFLAGHYFGSRVPGLK